MFNISEKAKRDVYKINTYFLFGNFNIHMEWFTTCIGTYIVVILLDSKWRDECIDFTMASVIFVNSLGAVNILASSTSVYFIVE